MRLLRSTTWKMTSIVDIISGYSWITHPEFSHNTTPIKTRITIPISPHFNYIFAVSAKSLLNEKLFLLEHCNFKNIVSRTMFLLLSTTKFRKILQFSKGFCGKILPYQHIFILNKCFIRLKPSVFKNLLQIHFVKKYLLHMHCL